MKSKMVIMPSIAGFLLIVIVFTVGIASGAKAEKEEEVDYLSLAALLVKDNHYDRAEKALMKVHPDDKQIDKMRYQTLYGLVMLKKGSFHEAARFFEQALRDERAREILSFYLAQAYFGANRYKDTLNALNKAGDSIKEMPAAYLLRARALWKRSQKEAAWRILEQAQNRFQGKTRAAVYRLKAFYLIELGFYSEAAKMGHAYFSQGEASVEDYLAIGEAFRNCNRIDEAKRILQLGVLHFPQNEKLYLAFAAVYHKEGRMFQAASMAERAAILDESFMKDAAELYMHAGCFTKALYLSTMIQKQKEKIRLRMGLYLAMGEFESAAAMGARLSRLGLLQEEEIRYALAYALYRTKRFDEAERNLKMLTSRKFFEYANTIRKAMSNCTKNAWECF